MTQNTPKTLHGLFVEVLNEAGLPLDFAERLTTRIITKMVENPDLEVIPTPPPSTYWEYLMSQGARR